MTRELEVLNWLLANETIYRGRTRLTISPTLRYIKQRLEQIDNSNPSETLKAVNNDLEGCYEYEKRTGINNVVSMAISKELLVEIQQALIKAQEMEKDIIHYKGTIDNLRRDNALLKDIKKEQEKVLEILKEHKINIYRLLDVESVSQYNEWENDNLTEDEFDTLKRYFE